MVSDLFHLGLTLTPHVTAWSPCVSNVLSSISKYANDSFKENPHEKREAFVETLVAVL